MDSYPMHAWHPLLVHFPLGLLLGGTAVEAAGWLSHRPGLRRAGLVLLTTGLLLALPAIATGLLAYGRVDHGIRAHELMKLHRNLALTSVGLFAVVVGWRWRAGERVTATRAASALYGVMLAAAAAGLTVVGYLGGELVYVHATGLPTATLERIMEERGEPEHHRAAGGAVEPRVEIGPAPADSAPSPGAPARASAADSAGEAGKGDDADPPHRH